MIFLLVSLHNKLPILMMKYSGKTIDNETLQVTDIRLQGLEFNNDGTKLFLMWFKNGLWWC